ncbi:hypothetical protein ACHWQZ_G017147 [Mnemiopsis leidyi]
MPQLSIELEENCMLLRFFSEPNLEYNAYLLLKDQASCEMRLHNDGAHIGKVTLSSYGNEQRVDVILKGDPEKVTHGYHALNIHSRAVRGNPGNCDRTGAIFKKRGRVLGDLGNVRAGERGEVNHYHVIKVDPAAREERVGLVEPVRHCSPVPYKVWRDGSEEKIENMEQAEMELQRLRMKGKDLFLIVYVEPDCYQPVYNRDTHTLNKPLFHLQGKFSIVGRAVLLQVDSLTSVDGSPGDAIACCTLQLEK